MINLAFVGHAGDAGSSVVFPHEIMGAVTILAIVGFMLIVLAVVGICLLLRIDRRLKRGSHDTEGHHEGDAPR